MKTKKLITLTAVILTTATLFTSCSKEEGCTDPIANNYDADADEDDGSCLYDTASQPVTASRITFNFTHNFDGTAVDNSNFNQFNHVTAFGDTLTISKLRYLISEISLHKANGDSVLISGYNLVDVTNATDLSYATTVDVPVGTYTDVTFNFGFDNADNMGNYLDLNSTSWNAPMMLGGGYHSMQLEGKYKHMGNDSSYAYHSIVLKRPTLTDPFEDNHINVSIQGLTLTNSNVNVEIKMDIAEWFKNPNTWDLNALHNRLMPSYTAQTMIQENGANVFSLGTVTQ